MKNANGTGSVYKLSGKRSRPWTAKVTVGMVFDEDNNISYCKTKYLGYWRTKSEAQQALLNYIKSPYELENKTVKEIADMWMEKQQELVSPARYKHLESFVNHLSDIHNCPIQRLSKKDIQICFDKMERTADVKKKALAILGRIYDYAIRYDIIPPERKIILQYIDTDSTVDVRKVSRTIFTKEEIAILEANVEDPICRNTLIFIYTGMRWIELYRLKPEDMHIEDKYSDIVILFVGCIINIRGKYDTKN